MYNVMERLARYQGMLVGAFGPSSQPLSYINGHIDCRNATGNFEEEDTNTSSGHPKTPNGYLQLTGNMFGVTSRSYPWIQNWIAENPDYADIQLSYIDEEAVMFTICRYHIGYDALDELTYVFSSMLPGWVPPAPPTSPIPLPDPTLGDNTDTPP